MPTSAKTRPIPEFVSKKSLAQLFGVVKATVEDWESQGVIQQSAPDAYELRTSVQRVLQNQIGHAKDEINGEKLRKLKLENARISRSVLASAEVEQQARHWAFTVVRMLNSLPGRLANALVGLSAADIRERIREEIIRICQASDEALGGLIEHQGAQRDHADRGGDIPAEAEAHARPVGERDAGAAAR